MKHIICALVLVFLCATFAMGFNCPAGSVPTLTHSIEVQTCGGDARLGDSSCPQGFTNGSQGFNFRLDGSEDAPQWLWGLLDEDENFKSQFYKMYEVNATSGEMVKDSVTELNTFAWTYCTPVQNGNIVSFTAYGSKDGTSILITGSIANDTTTDSFKWNFRLDDYVWATGKSNDLVLFSKYETEGGDNSGTEDGKESDHTDQVVNSNSYISTAKTASYNGNIFEVSSSATLNGETGYFIVFSTHGQSNSFSSLVLDPAMGITSSAMTLGLSIGALCFALLAALI